MYKFKKTPGDNDDVIVEVTLDHNEQTVDSLLEAFQDFMYGCGFRLKGDIDVIQEED